MAALTYLKAFIESNKKPPEVGMSTSMRTEEGKEGENDLSEHNAAKSSDNSPQQDCTDTQGLLPSNKQEEQISISEEETRQFMERFGNTEQSAILLCAALLWQKMEHHYLGANNVSQLQRVVEEIGNGHMGLIGPGNGCCTNCLEKSFGRSKIFRLHSLPHDVSGRFRKIHNLGPGYLYMVSVKEEEMRVLRWWRKVSLGGQVLGMIHAFKHRKDVQTADCFELISVQM